MSPFKNLGLTTFLLLLINIGQATACGFCIEDKIASVYDHAIVTQALSTGHQVVFCGISGTYPTNELGKTMQTTLNSVVAIDNSSTRISAENMAVAFTFDPSNVELDQILNILQRKLNKEGLKLEVLRVMKASAQLDQAK